MSESKRLTQRQAAVIEDLFVGELDEPAILKKHGVRPGQYERWLADESFTEQLELRIARALRQGRLVLARHAAQAAARLIELTRCQKEETARKACLDVIALRHPTAPGPLTNDPMCLDPLSPVSSVAGLNPAVASRLLAALARDPHDHKAEGSSRANKD